MSAEFTAALCARCALFMPHALSVLFITSISALFLPSARADALTIERAWQLAEQANPTLRQAQAELAAAQGTLTEAQALLFNNPVISTDQGGRRLGGTDRPASSRYEWGAGISQTFEIAGQPGARRATASNNLQAVQTGILETRYRLRAEVAQRFYQVLSLQQRIATEEKSLRLLERAASALRKRVKAGENSRLDGNLATVEAERAQSQIASARAQLVSARAELAALLQLSEKTLPEADGSLEGSALNYGLDELLAKAANRPLIRALEFAEKSARNRLDLERKGRYPDVTLGLNYNTEPVFGGTDRIALLNVSVPLPLFRRNDAGIGRAMTELTQVEVRQQAAKRDAGAQVFAAWQRQQALQARVNRLEQNVLPLLEENQRLSQRAAEVGEIGLAELLLVNRQVLEGQRDLIEARSELRLVQIGLETAAGILASPLPTE